jgi:hypothetical protein
LCLQTQRCPITACVRMNCTICAPVSN